MTVALRHMRIANSDKPVQSGPRLPCLHQHTSSMAPLYISVETPASLPRAQAHKRVYFANVYYTTQFAMALRENGIHLRRSPLAS